MQRKLLIILFIGTMLSSQSESSSIPMFEFLSRDEKLNTLYSMFANQVSTYCKNKANINASQCKRNMMVYGMNKLNEMEESHLDAMDPFSRDGDAMLWDSIMKNHDDTKTKQEEQRQMYLQKEQYHQQNPIFKEMTAEIEDHENYLHQGAATNNNYNYAISKPDELDNQAHLQENYLLGPMVSVLMPDGAAVAKGKVNIVMPVDDDMHDMTMGQGRMPTLQDLLDSMTMDEKPKIIMELPPTAATTPRARESRTIKNFFQNSNGTS